MNKTSRQVPAFGFERSEAGIFLVYFYRVRKKMLNIDEKIYKIYKEIIDVFGNLC